MEKYFLGPSEIPNSADPCIRSLRQLTNNNLGKKGLKLQSITKF